MSKLPKTWAGLQRRVKRQREERAIEAIIAGCMRGVDWKKVFEKVDDLKRKRQEDREHMEKHGGDIYG